jgi:hypothetical protein
MCPCLAVTIFFTIRLKPNLAIHGIFLEQLAKATWTSFSQCGCGNMIGLRRLGPAHFKAAFKKMALPHGLEVRDGKAKGFLTFWILLDKDPLESFIQE